MRLAGLTVCVLSFFGGVASAKSGDDADVIDRYRAELETKDWTLTGQISDAHVPGHLYDPATAAPIFEACVKANVSTGSAPETQLQNASGKVVSGGVSTGLAGARAGIGKRVYALKSISDAQWQYIPRNQFKLSEACRDWVEGQRAAGADISGWYVLQEALSVQELNVSCESKKAYLGLRQLIGVGGDIGTYSGCVQTNKTEGVYAFKGKRVADLMPQAVMPQAAATPAAAPVAPPPVSRQGGGITGGYQGGGSGGLGIAAQLAAQVCDDKSKTLGQAAREIKLDAAEASSQSDAGADWGRMKRELEMCVKLKRAKRGPCITQTERWLATSRSMSVTLGAGTEVVQTDCGPRSPVFAAQTRRFSAAEVPAAEALLTRLKAADAPVAGRASGVSGTNSVGMKFAAIPAGSFVMGCTAEQGSDCYDDEKPAHKVTLSRSFYMQTTEVTQGQWRAVMGSNPSKFSGCNTCPVEQVSWDDAVAFAEKLSAKEGLSGESVYRLPTEAEWEYAARAGQGTKYAGSNSLNAVAWHENNSGGKTHPVGQKSPNAWGLYDMSGNVWEWTADWHGGYSSGNTTNPEGASSGNHRVLRGGSWRNTAARARVALRGLYRPVARYNNLGFRLVRTIP